jgi:hypothetical protein
MFWVLYPFATYSLTLPRTVYVLLILNAATVRTMRLCRAYLFLSESLVVEIVSRSFGAYD